MRNTPRPLHDKPGPMPVVIAVVAAAFVLWASVLILRTSILASDGHRYFTLFDDAMISMRYAWNATHGVGLVWNPGEPVEGYTNLLMVGLMSVWAGLFDKSNAVLAVQVTGIPVLLGIAFLSRLHWLELSRGKDVQHSRGFDVLAFVAGLAYYPLIYWTLMGMETGLVALLLLVGSLLALMYMRTGMLRHLDGSSLAFSLAYLARPDTAPVAAAVLAASVLLGMRSRGRLAAITRSLGLYLFFPVLQTAFRWFYYENLVPITYTLKATGMPFAVRLQNGIGFATPFLKQTRWALVFAGAGTILGYTRRKAVLALPPMVIIAYQIAIGGDAWPYWRLVAPAVPYLFLLLLAGIDWITSAAAPDAPNAVGRWSKGLGWETSLTRPDGHRIRALRVLLLMLAVGLFMVALLGDYLRSGSPGFGSAQASLVAIAVIVAWIAARPRTLVSAILAATCATLLLLRSANAPFLKEVLFVEPPYKAEANRDHLNAALSILRYTTDEATVGVFQAGIIPFYTSRYAIDFLGKNDPYIAGLPIDLDGGPAWYGMTSVPGHNKYDLEYSIRQRLPTYVEGFSWGSQDVSDVFRDQYVEVSLPGPDPAFRREDPAVRWDLIPLEKILVP